MKAENRAEKGRTATIQYTIILEDGTRVGEKKTKPLTFKIGSKKVIPALDRGVVGMQVNEKRQVLVTASQGYGEYNKELVFKVERKQFPEDLNLVPGRTVQYQNRDGERANFVIQQVDEKGVILDGNHPLAGQDLIYEVELLSLS